MFGAVELFRLVEPSGRIGHVELQFGPSIVMLAGEFPEMGFTAPPANGLPVVCIHLHVDDGDAMGARAVAAGARMLNEPAEHFYGERSCRVLDPFGHTWMLGHSIEKVAPDEVLRRYTAMFGG